MESQFKKGDRVRFNDRCVNYDNEVIVGGGDMGTITDISAGGYVTVELDSPEYITVQERDIQIVEPYNRKNAFLLELKGLLEKYGAEIELLSYDLDTTQLGITSDDFEVEYPIDVQQITAKNIMDYNKE